MNDLISRQATINAIDALHEKPNAWLDSAVDAVMALPSAQPEPHYDEWCMDCKEYDKERHCCPRWNRVIRQTLKNAQPEIIYCKDCKNSEHWYKDRRRCFLWSEDGVSVWDSGYCNYAERRTDD